MKDHTILTPAALAFVVAGLALPPSSQAETVTPSVNEPVSNASDEISGIRVPDSKLARDAARIIRESEAICSFSTPCAFTIGQPWRESARI